MSKRPLTMLSICALVACSSGQKSSSNMDGGDDAGAVAPLPTQYRVSLLFGTPGGRGAADGVASAARFNNVTGLTGNGSELTAVDWLNGALRSVSLTDGSVRTLAGRLGYRSSPVQDGPVLTATFAAPFSAALLGDGLFVGDLFTVRRLSLAQNQVETLRDPATGMGWQSSNYYVRAVTTCGDLLYFSDGITIWRYSPANGSIVALAGGSDGFRDGIGDKARFGFVMALACQGGMLYVADICTIRRVDTATGAVVTLAGVASEMGDAVANTCASQDGVGTSAAFLHIMGLASDGQMLYATEEAQGDVPAGKTKPTLAVGYGTIRRIDPATARVTTFAGDVPQALAGMGELSGDGAQARFLHPQGIWADDSAVYVGTASGIHRILKSTGATSLLAGTVQKGGHLIPGAMAWNGTALDVLFEQEPSLAMLDVTTGVLDTRAIYDKVSFPIEYCDGLVRQGDTLYCSSGDLYAIGPTLQASKLPSWQGDCWQVAAMGDHLVTAVQSDVLTINETSLTGATIRVLYQTEKVDRVPRLAADVDSVILARQTTIQRISRASGTVDLSLGGERGCVDGDFANARFGAITGLAFDGQRILVGDAGCHQLRAIDLGTRTVQTLVGSPTRPTFLAGDSTTASLNNPDRIVVDAATHRIFVSDNLDNVVAVAEPLP